MIPPLINIKIGTLVYWDSIREIDLIFFESHNKLTYTIDLKSKKVIFLELTYYDLNGGDVLFEP